MLADLLINAGFLFGFANEYGFLPDMHANIN